MKITEFITLGKVWKTGNGYVVSLPKRDLNLAGINKGDKVFIKIELAEKQKLNKLSSLEPTEQMRELYSGSTLSQFLSINQIDVFSGGIVQNSTVPLVELS